MASSLTLTAAAAASSSSSSSSSSSDILHNGTITSSSRGFIADLLNQRSHTELTILLAILASAAILLPLLNSRLTPTMHPLEPPLIRPTIPLIGHIVGIIRHQSDYHRIVSSSHPSQPLVTLQMLTGKLYTVFDPQSIQTLLRSKTASMDPFVRDFSQKTFDLSKETWDALFSDPAVIGEFTDVIHASFQPASVQRMNARFLESISAKMSPISQGSVVVDAQNAGREKPLDGGLEVENLFLWFRDVMTLATTKSLFGRNDPFSKDPSLIGLIWIFEAAIPSFLVTPYPALTMPKAFRARQTLQRVLGRYYAEGHDQTDPTASQLVRGRANALRGYGVTDDQIGHTEIILPDVATVNAVPTHFWIFRYVFDRPELTQRLRREVEAAATVAVEADGERKTVSFNILEFEDRLPLLVSCYRETLRLTNHSCSVRRVMQDMTVTSSEGRTYVLKKGVDLQLPSGVTHNGETIWGAAASDFDPERFIPPATRDRTAEGLEAEKRRKAAYFPFGGGRHLCPGRNFAFAEILGFMAVLLLGFELEPTGMQRFGDLKMQPPQLVSATVKPERAGEGLGARIRPRKGWEGVEWKFVC